MGDLHALRPCQLCGSPYLAPFLDLGSQPLAERYIPDARHYPLRLVRCASCTLVQLADPPPQEDLFPPEHPYATGNTAANRAHFAKLAVAAGWRLEPGDAVLDIGANDGTFLSCFSDDVIRIAVEPTRQAEKIYDAYRYREFFTSGLARRIREEHGRARLITACNVLAHVPDPHDFLAGVAILLADDGEFITENHDLASITDGLQVDTVYHEHLRYWDVATLSRLLADHGLAVTRSEPVAMHGGSFRVTARHTAYSGMQERAREAAVSLHDLVADLHRAGNTVYGISAATRATPLMWFADIGQYLECVCEAEGSEKIGKVMPGTRIPVVGDGKLIADQPEYALLFCWHIADSVIGKLRAAGYQGKFIVPLPEPEVIDA